MAVLVGTLSPFTSATAIRTHLSSTSNDHRRNTAESTYAKMVNFAKKKFEKISLNESNRYYILFSIPGQTIP